MNHWKYRINCKNHIGSFTAVVTDYARREGSNLIAASETNNPAEAGLLVSGGEGDCKRSV